MSISIIIPSYGQAHFLTDALESAYSQTLPAHEIIVVDDGSTDGSLEIANQYRFAEFPAIESPVRVISQTNKGLASARNTGIMNATGDYVLFLDADDILCENAIEVITRTINETNADIIAPSFREFGISNRIVILQPFTVQDFVQGNRLGYFSAIRRSVLLEVGGYNPKMTWGWEDYDLWFDLFKRNKTCTIIQEPLVWYRVKEQSMIQVANAHAPELAKQLRINHPQIQWPQ